MLFYVKVLPFKYQYIIFDISLYHKSNRAGGNSLKYGKFIMKKNFFLENVTNAIELDSNLEFLNSKESFGFKQARAVDRLKSLLNLQAELFQLEKEIKSVRSIYGFPFDWESLDLAKKLVEEKINQFIKFDAIWHSNIKVNPVVITGGLLKEFIGLEEINKLFNTRFNRVWDDVESHNNGLNPSDWAYHYILR